MTSVDHLSNGKIVAEFQATAEDHFLASNWVIKNLHRIRKNERRTGDFILFIGSLAVVLIFYWLYESWNLFLTIGGVEMPGYLAWVLSSLPLFSLIALILLSYLLSQKQASKTLKAKFVPQLVSIKINDHGVLFDGLKRAFFIAFSEIQSVEPLKHGYVVSWGTFASFIPCDGFPTKSESDKFFKMLRGRVLQESGTETLK
jgi:hypothetical protein